MDERFLLGKLLIQSNCYTKSIPGSFQGLNAEDISEEVQNNWRVMHKLQKSFADAIMPRKVADFCKHKIDRFKNHLPLLLVICNPGLRERHWTQVGIKYKIIEIIKILIIFTKTRWEK